MRLEVTPLAEDGAGYGETIYYPVGTAYRFDPNPPEPNTEQFLIVNDDDGEHRYSLWSHLVGVLPDDDNPPAEDPDPIGRHAE